MKELRTLDSSALRGLCIKYNWYTRGSEKEYRNLLNFVESKKNLTTSDILLIANNIIKNSSNVEHELTDVCFKIAKRCVTLFVEE